MTVIAQAGRHRLKRSKTAGMKLLRGGEFLMGSDAHYPEEAPVRWAVVGDFWIDEHPVTNRQFAVFVAETGYVTFAETAPDPRQYPGLPPEMARAGSAVFTPPDTPVDLGDSRAWWRFVFGADWRNPLGPDTSAPAILDHPVVQVAYADAQAYAEWAGKALPSEDEWEYAARGGRPNESYAWGNELVPEGRMMANYWQGAFPWENTAEDGFERTSPVRSFPPNGFGLYDMIGNVWEWTVDWYSPAVAENGSACCGAPRSGMAAEIESHDPSTAAAGAPGKVLKGGSHLCSPNYCQRYRPAARYPQPVDSPTSHIGFRCIARR
ncbi:MAG TPA: formylglycine-generating enzyme family protein, partial [Opitutaceae bacterium]|jgi:formylglycine-generating enzyme required for sulfatase activity|nr:formylglycine-generating enzyme family protein [Opitutaceae bacterium]